MSKIPPKRNIILFNILFVVVVGGILLFLWHAPPETTPRLPGDDNHQRFFTMERKAAESHCETCHQPDGVSPLSADHPPTFRCLFCHKLPE